MRQAQCPVGAKPEHQTLRAQMLPTLVSGFMAASLIVFAVVHYAGARIHSQSLGVAAVLASAVLVACGLADLFVPQFRGTLVKRQTPHTIAFSRSAAATGLIWGLDTGSVFSTFRASPSSWGALALAFVGWGPWWIGVGYGVGFVAPLSLLVISYPIDGREGRGLRFRSTDGLVRQLSSSVRYARLGSGSIALLASVAVFLGAFFQ